MGTGLLNFATWMTFELKSNQNIFLSKSPNKHSHNEGIKIKIRLYRDDNAGKFAQFYLVIEFLQQNRSMAFESTLYSLHQCAFQLYGMFLMAFSVFRCRSHIKVKIDSTLFFHLHHSG
jgi:hypothetical protein